jgi:probable F420-dependent oxidoreductase
MDFAINLPVAHPSVDPGLTRDLARRAEDLGFVAVYLGEHVVLFDELTDAYPGSESGDITFPSTSPIPDPLVTLAFIASATEHIRLATGVLLLPQRNPVYVAKEVATLDWLSGGRVDLGIGIGWSRQEFGALHATWPERGARCDDYVAVLRALWAQDVSAHDGPVYRLAPCRQYPKPVQRPHPPLWIGGSSDGALARVARIGDGWYGFDIPPATIAGRVAQLERLLEQHGRFLHEVPIAMGAYIHAPADRADLAPYERAGVSRFVLNLISADPGLMHQELASLGTRFGVGNT